MTQGMNMPALPHSDPVIAQIVRLYLELFEHDGYGELKLDIRLLKRGQKEIVISCGKQYRFVINYDPTRKSDGGNSATSDTDRSSDANSNNGGMLQRS